MSRFKVGDEVRVKAGSPTAFDGDGVAPYQRSFGEKLKIKGDVNGGRKRVDGLTYWHVVFGEDGGQDVITENYLEPWNPAEEWDGVKWVPKKPYRGILAAEDHIVILRENGVLKPNSPPHVHPSLEDAYKEAKRLAAKHKGQEFCVFGLKAVEKREKEVESPIVSAVFGRKKATLECDGVKQDVIVEECAHDLRWGQWDTTGRIRSAGDPVKS